jgi:hypothetical protein
MAQYSPVIKLTKAENVIQGISNTLGDRLNDRNIFLFGDHYSRPYPPQDSI